MRLFQTKILAAVLFIFFAIAPAYSGNYTKNQNYQTYKNGFAISIYHSTSTAGFDLGYYFLKNNQMFVGVGISPYTAVNNIQFIEGRNIHSTILSLGAQYYFRLWPSELNNTFFLSTGFAWSETFGTANVTYIRNRLNYFYSIAPLLGLEYRVNPHFYISALSAISYNKIQLKKSPGFGFSKVQSITNIFSTATIRFTVKF